MRGAQLKAPAHSVQTEPRRRATMKTHRPRDERGFSSVEVLVGASVWALFMMAAMSLAGALNDGGAKTHVRAATTSSAVELANRIRKSVNSADVIADVTDDRLTLDTTNAYGKTTRTVWTATADGHVVESSTEGPAAEIAALGFDVVLPEVHTHTDRLGTADVAFTWDGGDFVEYSIGHISTGAAAGKF
ncbi:type IV pilus modification PilV family protein [Nocardioides pinisoli]|uniref:Prepilin-type N-terminal cleavage/methylation domain-containing protein n=1 Tax=Nocardioides pinisoli TaxID=2950279 RepID=A0ABT1KSJ4_9ACTN|nr:hypothetical protein [Nocardioides pinisoli]MCP3420329.1 hypothetical protein [Nocardioides pinisoli]